MAVWLLLPLKIVAVFFKVPHESLRETDKANPSVEIIFFLCVSYFSFLLTNFDYEMKLKNILSDLMTILAKNDIFLRIRSFYFLFKCFLVISMLPIDIIVLLCLCFINILMITVDACNIGAKKSIQLWSCTTLVDFSTWGCSQVSFIIE